MITALKRFYFARPCHASRTLFLFASNLLFDDFSNLHDHDIRRRVRALAVDAVAAHKAEMQPGASGTRVLPNSILGGHPG
jgi:hypothetical protein